MTRDQFDRLQNYHAVNAKPRILCKFLRYTKYLSEQNQMYLEFILEAMFKEDSHFSEAVKTQLEAAMGDVNKMLFLQFAFLNKKSLIGIQQNFETEQVDERRLDNFEFFFRLMFRKMKEISKMNSFVTYSILQFAKLVRSDRGSYLIRRFRGLPLIKDHLFWKTMLVFLKNNVHKSPPKPVEGEETDETERKSFIRSVSSFFKTKQPLKKPKTKTAEKETNAINKSFQETAGLLFRIEFDFRDIVLILIKLALRFAIDAKLLERIVVANKPVLFHQLLQKNKLIQSIDDLRSLESRRLARSYQSIVQGKSQASLNESLYETSLGTSLARFEESAGQRLSKILMVIKLSVGFLVGMSGVGTSLSPICGRFAKVQKPEVDSIDVKNLHWMVGKSAICRN